MHLSLQVGRHPLKANSGNIACNSRGGTGHAGIKEKTRYGTTASSETSPLSSRKNSTSNGQEKSPLSNRRQSSNIQAPQRPSRLPVVSMYDPKQSLTTNSHAKRPQIAASRKATPPCQDHEPIQLSPLTPANKYMRRNSMSPTASLVGKRGMSPTTLASKRSASPSRSSSKRTASPKRGDVSRRVPSPVFATRKRSPSLTRSVSF